MSATPGDRVRPTGRNVDVSAPQPAARSSPTDPDVDVSLEAQRQEMRGHHLTVLGAIAAGGIIGALARYQIGRSWPTPTGGFPTATLCINLLGCLVIGAFMVLITEVFTPHRLLRPFVATGVLGGFTTFSTYAVDIQTLISSGRASTALAYLAATAVGAVVAVTVGMFSVRFLHRGHVRPT